MIAPKNKFSEQDLVNLFLWGGDRVYGRFVVNELKARNSDLLKKNVDLFLSSSYTRVACLIALGDMDGFVDFPVKATN